MYGMCTKYLYVTNFKTMFNMLYENNKKYKLTFPKIL